MEKGYANSLSTTLYNNRQQHKNSKNILVSPPSHLSRTASTQATINVNFTTQTSRSSSPVSRLFPSHINHVNSITTQVRLKPKSQCSRHPKTVLRDDNSRKQFLKTQKIPRPSKTIKIDDATTKIRRIQSTNLNRYYLKTYLSQTYRSSNSVRTIDDVTSLRRVNSSHDSRQYQKPKEIRGQTSAKTVNDKLTACTGFERQHLYQPYRSLRSVRINDHSNGVEKFQPEDYSGAQYLESELSRIHRSSKFFHIADADNIVRNPSFLSKDLNIFFLENQISRSIDVRYTMTDLKNYFDKISKYPFYFFNECEPLACPSLKERLIKHICDQHSLRSDYKGQMDFSSQQNPKKPPYDYNGQMDFSQQNTMEDTAVISPYEMRKEAILSKYGRRGPVDRSTMNKDNSSAQTEMTYTDLKDVPNSFFTSDDGQRNETPRNNKRYNYDKSKRTSKNISNFAEKGPGGYNKDRPNGLRHNTDSLNKSYHPISFKYNIDPNSSKYSKDYRPNSSTFKTDPLNGSFRVNGSNSNTIPYKSYNTNNIKKEDSNTFDNGYTPSQCISNYEPTDNNDNGNPIPLMRTDTHEIVTPKQLKNNYEENLREEIKAWVKKLPLHPNPNAGSDKDKIVSDLIERVMTLVGALDDHDYEDKLRREVNKYLNELQIMYPGDKRDQAPFKQDICDDILKKIKELNDIWFPIKDTSTPEKKFGIDDLYNFDNYNKEKYTSLRGNRSKSDPIKCTISSNYICDNLFDTDVKKKGPCKKDCKSCQHELEYEISVWLKEANIVKMNMNQLLTNRDLIGILSNRLAPYLRKPYNITNRIILKAKIVEILDSLPICVNCTKSQRIRLLRFAEELAKKLLNMQAKFEKNNYRCRKCSTAVHRFQHIDNEIISSNTTLKNYLLEEIKYCLGSTKWQNENYIEDNILDLLMNNIDAICSGYERVTRNEIFDVLQRSNDLSSAEILDTIDCIFENVKEVIKQFNKEMVGSQYIQPSLSGTVSVFTSEQELSQPSLTIPVIQKNKPDVNNIPKLTAAERDYMNKVAALIRTWVDTLPKQLNESIDINFKETIINDLACDIMEQAKLEQISPDPNFNRKKFWTFSINRWLYKFYVFKDLDEADTHIKKLVNKLYILPIPIMTRSQHDCRQTTESKASNGANVLQDEISRWIYEQPSAIYLDIGKSTQNQMVEELAEALQPRLNKNSSSKEISKEVVQCLEKIVKPEENKKINKMAKKLTERILKLTQDATLLAKIESRNNKVSSAKLNINRSCDIKCNEPCSSKNISPVCSQSVIAECCLDQTIKNFIIKYLDHNYDVDDPMARRAFAHLLRTELQRLTVANRKEIDEKYQVNSCDKFVQERLDKELQHIQDVSDWLKYLPVESSFNIVGNKDRIEFVNGLARNISEIENERAQTPDAMDYNLYLGGIISEHMGQLPLLPEQVDDINFNRMITQLLNKIIARRQTHTSVTNQTSINISEIPEHNLTEFIEKYIRIKSQEVADDELKLDAWSKRIVDEIKKMVFEDPNTLIKGKVNDRLANLSFNKDPLRWFSVELEYTKEISEWLKNMPLLNSTDSITIKMISNLAKRISERDQKKIDSSDYAQYDAELKDYISNWISQLPFDNTQQIDIPFAVLQLINRIETVNKNISNGQRRLSMQTKDSILLKLHKFCSRKCKTKPRKENKTVTNNFGGLIVDAIESWCNNLPIKGDIESVKIAKNNIATKLYQKVGELNDNPLVYNEEFTYKEMLTDEIDTQFCNIPNNLKFQGNKDKLKADLLEQVMEALTIIKESEAGESYEQKLENTIETSMPNPISMPAFDDPAFKIYKHRLAEMFIIDNLDHGNEANKLKYEKKLKNDLDKFYHSAQRRNAIHLTQDQLVGELFTALFKVPVPDEHSIKYEIEEVKTRCEIDSWFDELPLRHADGVGQLLEWDQILKKLAKRVHELEKEKNSNDKIYKEIIKVLTKLPLQPGHESNMNVFAGKLQSRLQATVEARQGITNVESHKTRSKSKDKSDTSEVACNSSVNSGRKRWSTSVSIQQPQMPINVPEKKYADYILEIVEDWSNQLPLPAETPNEVENNKFIRDDFVTQIIIKISELNSNPETFNNDILYKRLLNDEINNLISTLPQSDALQQSKNARINQLNESLKCVMLIIKKERACHEFKQKLKDSVTRMLIEPKDTTVDKAALIDNIKEEIVDNFIKYCYSNDDESKLYHKGKIQEAMFKYISIIKDGNNRNVLVDPKIKGNELINELSKVPMPNEAVVEEEIQKNRIKNEVDNFFKELVFPKYMSFHDEIIRNQTKISVAKLLSDIEKCGHTSESDQKIKAEIAKCLEKLDVDVTPEQIDGFMDKLKQNESLRRPALPNQMFGCSRDASQFQSPHDKFYVSYDQSGRPNILESAPPYDQQVFADTSAIRPSIGGHSQWYTLSSNSGQSQSNVLGSGIGANINNSTANCSDFREGVLLNSTPNHQTAFSGPLPGSRIPFGTPSLPGPAYLQRSCGQYPGGTDPSIQQSTESERYGTHFSHGSPMYKLKVPYAVSETPITNSEYAHSFRHPGQVYSQLSKYNQGAPDGAPSFSTSIGGEQWRTITSSPGQFVSQPTSSAMNSTVNYSGFGKEVGVNSTPVQQSQINPRIVSTSSSQYTGGFDPSIQQQAGYGTQWMSLTPGSTLPSQDVKLFESMTTANDHRLSMAQVLSPNVLRGMNANVNESTIDYSGFAGGVGVNSTFAQPRRSILRNKQTPDLNSSSGNYSQWHTIVPNSSHAASTFPGTLQYSLPPESSVLPWNTASSLGSVEEPSKQAVVLIHKAPEPGLQTVESQFRPATVNSSYVPSLTGDLNLPSSPPYPVPLYHDPMVIGKYGPSLDEGWSPKVGGGRDTILSDSPVDYQNFSGGIPLSVTVRNGRRMSNATGIQAARYSQVADPSPLRAQGQISGELPPQAIGTPGIIIQPPSSQGGQETLVPPVGLSPQFISSSGASMSSTSQRPIDSTQNRNELRDSRR